MIKTLSLLGIAGVIAVCAVATARSQEFATTDQAPPAPALIASLATICEPDRFVLSDAAIVACATQRFPRLVADGSRFRNAGVGAELNTLLRQLPAAPAATPAE